jgi:predicted alpha/beta-hydrolase family hydrolase
MSEIPLLVDEPREKKGYPTVVLAHGAGSAMDSPFMEEIAHALAAESIRVVRFEFPYMHQKRESGRRGPPDAPAVLQETWMRVVEQLRPAKLVIGGKSMGGRIASMVADKAGVQGLVCLGYPFHPAGKPATLRVAHLAELSTPTLILQGERDDLGSREEIGRFTLSKSIRVEYLPDGDHSFKPRKSSGHTLAENMTEALKQMVAFVTEVR